MKLQMYTIFDIKARIYEQPKFCLNEETAKRLFIATFSNSKTSYNRFPQDFRVFFIGTYDDETCLVSPINPIYKWLAHDLIKEDNADKTMLFQKNQANNKTQEKKDNAEQKRP